MDLGSSIGWGAGLFFLLPIGSVLLLVTVVGIPLGVFTLLALAFIYTLGYVVATIGLGSRVMRLDAVAVRGVPRRLGRPPTARPDPVRRRLALVPRRASGARPAGGRDPDAGRRRSGAGPAAAPSAAGAGRGGLAPAGARRTTLARRAIEVRSSRHERHAVERSHHDEQRAVADHERSVLQHAADDRAEEVRAEGDPDAPTSRKRSAKTRFAMKTGVNAERHRGQRTGGRSQSRGANSGGTAHAIASAANSGT